MLSGGSPQYFKTHLYSFGLILVLALISSGTFRGRAPETLTPILRLSLEFRGPIT